MKVSSVKPNADDSLSTVTRTKTGAKVFAATSSSAPSTGTTTKTTRVHLACIAHKNNHPLWRCRVFLNKTPTESAKVVAENKLCFSCLKGNHSFRQCSQPHKCKKDNCSSSHDTLFYGAERVLQPRTTSNTSRNHVTSSCILT